MTLVYVFAAVVIVVLAGLAVTIRRHGSVRSADEAVTKLRAIDVEAFRTLSSREDSLYLRALLSHADWREVERQRTTATLVYVSDAFHNAGVLVRLADLARHNDNKELAAAADQLADRAIRVRVQSSLTIARLLCAYVVPELRLSASPSFTAYTELKDYFLRYSLTAYPKLASQLSLAL